MRDLTADEIVGLLEAEETGRIGVYDREHDRVYVVPISYVYRDGALYFHSAPGLKLTLLEGHPTGVCFQVDQITDISDWRSAVCWGHVEYIDQPEERRKVLSWFGDRLYRGPLRSHQNVGRGGSAGAGETVYRLQLDQLSGRSDSSS